MNKCLYAAKVILLGLLTAQVLSTMQVYLSNADLYWKLTFIRDAGYLVVPNQQIMDHLQEFNPAFFGGLFFTLTVGAGLSLCSFAAAWIWLRLLFRSRFVLILLVLLWLGALIAVNYRELCLLVTSYFLIIPPVVFLGTLRWTPEENTQKAWLHGLIHVVPVVLLALLWTSQLNSHMFVDIRDNLLLSNSLGKRINDFYYEYTFYPAEVFKPLHSKTLRTCNLESVKHKTMAQPLENALLTHDYLSIGGYEAVDLQIEQQDDDLLFRNKGKTILRATVHDFLSRPRQVLKEFSLGTDKYVLFRQFTFLSLLVGFPVALYLLLRALICAALAFFLAPRTSAITATILCFLFGVVLLIPLHLASAGEANVKALKESLESTRWQDRVAAVKLMQEERIDVATFGAYQKMLASPHIPERAWLARALGISRRPETYGDLVALLDDPSPSVVSMAFYALGKRGDRKAIEEIIKRIKASHSWYNQWYAYKALRKLGWKQATSKPRR